MEMPLVSHPRLIRPNRVRPPLESIPQTRAEREQARHWAEAYIGELRPVPPLSLRELRSHADQLIRRWGGDAKHRDYLAILLNNGMWREMVAAVPFERRLLLLPKCLRVEGQCPATFDELGLVCKQCGLCSIQDLQNEAERLGYAVLVAEGSAVVMQLIQTGRIEAIIGVSCMSVLEKAFPYMEAAAIPGLAIPLLQGDCRNTTVDIDWIWDAIHLTSDDRTYRLDLEGLHHQVEAWFKPASLDQVLGPADSQTEQIARAWLGKSGKRWRPFLAACVYKAMQPDPDAALPEGLRKIAVAVECFHKASLVHDDIEDGDATRYGEKTLHEAHGVPVALNVGDLLLGEGYRLIGECDAPAEVGERMLRVAAAGHRTLCLGQGVELCWMRDPRPLSAAQVLDIFRRKTAPAFEVALRLAAEYAGADESVGRVIGRYSEALGIAYQIRDDLDDLAATDEPDDLSALRPSLPLALTLEAARGRDRELLERLWRRSPEASVEQARRLMRELGVEGRCRSLLEAYKEEAVRALSELENASLKGLLRRVVGKILMVQIEGWCSEFEARNAGSGAAGAPGAG